MTLTQYKKVIKSLTRDELEAHLFEMFKSSKVFKDIESSCWSVESNDELIVSLQKRLEKVFWKEQFSLSECKGVLNDYLSRTVDEGTKALMHLAFAAEAAELSAVYGDYGGRFYNSLESSAGLGMYRPEYGRFRGHADGFAYLKKTGAFKTEKPTKRCRAIRAVFTY